MTPRVADDEKALRDALTDIARCAPGPEADEACARARAAGVPISSLSARRSEHTAMAGTTDYYAAAAAEMRHMDIRSDDEALATAREVCGFFGGEPGPEEKFRRQYAGLQGDPRDGQAKADAPNVLLKDTEKGETLAVDGHAFAAAFNGVYGRHFDATWNGRLAESGLDSVAAAAARLGMADLAAKLNHFRTSLKGLALVLRPDGSMWQPTPIAKVPVRTGEVAQAAVTTPEVDRQTPLAAEVEQFFSRRGTAR